MPTPQHTHCLEQLRFVEMTYVIQSAALDLLLFVLGSPESQTALTPIISSQTGLNWTHVALHLPGVESPMHQPIGTDVALSARDHWYATVHFASLRDLAMVMKRYLRTLVTTYYDLTADSGGDTSWFHSWRDFLVYTNVDIESIPEAPAVARVFEIDDFLSVNSGGVWKEKFGASHYFNALAAARTFISAVDEMVMHDLSTRSKKNRK